MEYARACLAATNPAVRTAAISFLATLRIYVPSLPSLLEGEKPALLATLTEKFAEAENQKPPTPSRSERNSGSKFAAAAAATSASAVGGGEGGPGGSGKTAKQQEEDALDDLIPRVDLTAMVERRGRRENEKGVINK